MLAQISVLLTPFVQLGFSYYASFATLLFALMLIQWRQPLVAGAWRALPWLAPALVMPLSLWAEPSIDPGYDLLRVLREALGFIVIMCAVAGFPMLQTVPRGASDLKPTTLVIGLLFLVGVIQTLTLPRGIYFGVPAEYFPLESGTLPSELSLIYNGGSLRPMGTFSEPSYFGFVLLTLALGMAPRAAHSKYVRVLLAATLVLGLLSRSLSFLIGAVLVLLIPYLLDRGENRRAGLVIGLGVVGALALAFTRAGNLLTRLAQIGTSTTADASAASRVFDPLTVLPSYLAEFPGGVASSMIPSAIAFVESSNTQTAGEILNNGIFNLVFAYGYVGILLMLALLVVAKDLRVRGYLLVVASQNGAFLSVDKVALILLGLGLYYSGRLIAAGESSPGAGEAGEPQPGELRRGTIGA